MLKYKRIFFILMFLIISLLFLVSCSYSTNKSTSISQNTLSTWLWDTSLIEKKPDLILDFLKEEKITVLYLQIDKTLDKEYYRKFISSAKDLDVSIYALDGRPEFIYPQKSEYQLFFDWLEEYQSSASIDEIFQGIHLDVEPYLLENWKTNMTSIVLNYQTFVLNSTEQSHSLNLDIGFDMPFWFDSIEYDNKYGQGNLAEFVIKNSEETTLMAYRNVSDEIIEISQNEIEFADNYKKKVHIGIETLPSEEGDFITFNKESYATMIKQIEEVKEFFSSSKSFNGIAIHEITGWMNLKTK
ncbi:hypothetical protein [Clostridium grantii]|uniref:Amidase n=1 Tax=Clostridium grantii DSM 8605 TaxID=1121316 RepID=A0A1M5QJZ5_9CLOT|nr:hypothetical protein [Clostridium grantii]SHH14318.1 hypothetical protein SAMN02745207_00142 [Clostridium grantii DSM 8605]